MFDFRNKRILIMGLGLHGGGVGTARFFARKGAVLTITDLRGEEQLRASIEKLEEFPEITYVLGRHRKNDFLHADLIIKNPGIPPASSYLAFALKHHVPITTDVGIFLRQCPATIIGVTGTRGKSTTCFLIFRFLKSFFHKNQKKPKRRVFLGGNIRASVLDFLEEAGPDDLVVLELSSFQLDDIARDSWEEESWQRKSPSVAVLTNILRDHMNWHGAMKNYKAAKSVIFLHQKPEEVVFANRADPMVRKLIARAPSRVIFPHLPNGLGPIVDKNLGIHYRSSVALAAGVGEYFNVPKALMVSVLKTFKGLPGRQEHVATINGVRAINDTTATIPDASIAAIKRFRSLAKKRKLILIAGGTDKQLKFSQMVKIICTHVDHLILLPGSATEKLLHELGREKSRRKKFSLQQAASMQQAVDMAFAIATKGDYILLSPGAASFGLFANEFDRGDAFAAAVRSHA